MTDLLLEINQNPLTRRLVKGIKLPIPLPEKLLRPKGPSDQRPLDNKRVLVGGTGDLIVWISRLLVRAGADPWLASNELEATFQETAEAFGRPLRVASESDIEAGEKIHALVMDASAVNKPRDLRSLYDLFHPWIRSLHRCGRVCILGRPSETAETMEQAAARAALDGFTRSVAKEIGSKGATSNLIIVEEGAEDRVNAVLRFLLSSASAFVSAQPLKVSHRVEWDQQDPWVRPLENKVALVTGAARGIGAAIARVLAQEGAKLVCLDRPEESADLGRLVHEIDCKALLVDVSDPETPDRLVTTLNESYGGVDIVVHNAGVTRDKTLARMTESHWEQTIEINLNAVIRMTDKLLDSCLRNNGRIVSLSSIAGIAGNLGQTNYAASKAGIIGFTRYLAQSLAPRGITVNAVAPGFIETKMTAAIPAVTREAGRRLSALGQGGLPQDVANVVGFLASPGASGVTGNIVRICGGALIGA